MASNDLLTGCAFATKMSCMEANIPIQQEKQRRPLLILLLGMLAGVVGALLPAALCVVPAVWAYAMCRTKPISLVACGGVFLALEMSLLGAFNGACFAVLAVGCAAALYYMQTKRIGNAYTLAAVSGIASVCLYALVCLPGILSGEGAFTAVQGVLDESVAAFRALTDAMGTLPVENADTFYQSLDAYVKMLPTFIVPALCIGGGVLGLSNFLFFRLFCRGKGYSITPLRPFKYWAIPRDLTTGLIVMLLGSFIMSLTGWDYADALSNTVNVLVGMPLLLQGLCVLDFLLSRKADGKETTRRVLTYLVTGLLFVVLQTPLIMLGCFDQVFRFRTRATAPPRT